MIKNKLVCVFLCVVVMSSISLFSSAATIPEKDQEQSGVITIKSVNEEECGLCDVHVERSFNPEYMKKDFPHTVPAAVIKVWTETACTGNEFNPDCDDDDNDDNDDDDDNGDPFPPALPDSSELAQPQDLVIEQEENEIKNILFGDNDEESVGCSLCADNFEQELIGVDGSVSLFDEQQLSQTGTAPSGVVNLDSSQQASEAVEAISIEAQPIEADNPCWFQPEDGASVTFYPPENVYVYPESIGIGCGAEKYVTLSVRSDDAEITGSIEIPYNAVSINSFDTPFVSCSGMNICGVATAWGYGAEDPNLPTITINIDNQDLDETLPSMPPNDMSEEYNQVNAGRNVLFDASSLDDGGSSDAVYSWDFGDGTVSDGGIEASHVYKTPGEYKVELTIEENGVVLDKGAADVFVVESDDATDLGVEEQDDVKPDNSPTFIDRILQMIQDLLSRILG